MTKLRLNATIIREVKGTNFYTDIGAAFQHQDKNGFDLVLDAMTHEFALFLAEEIKTEALNINQDATYYNVLIKKSVRAEDDKWKNFYTKIGAAYPHKSKRGFNVSLYALPVIKDGVSLVIREPINKENNQ